MNATVSVRLVLQATLRQRFPNLPDPLRTQAASVGELLDEQRIPRAEAAMLFVNGGLPRKPRSGRGMKSARSRCWEGAEAGGLRREARGL